VKDALVAKIGKREAVVGVVGLGYVGLPLLLEFAKGGFRCVGFDIDPAKPAALVAGRSYIRHIASESVASAFVGADPKRATATTDFSRVRECDAVLICVPTPLTHHREPDLTFIENTARSIAPHMRAGQLVILESTTYPGTTEEVMVPILEAGSGLRAGEGFLAAFSPEREDPNNRDFRTATIPKVVGGMTPDSLDAAVALYGSVICKTVPVSSCRAAEATKLMENIFRSVNIALVNELKLVFGRMGVDIWEVVDAARTKPFGFMPFYPGPGLGGHCIPIDPFYLTWKAKEYGIATRFIELAGEINSAMPDHVIQQAIVALSDRGRAMRGARVLLVGLAYKKNVDDTRESPSLALWRKLLERGARVDYYDPFCPVVPRTREYPELADIRSRTWEEAISGGYDAALVSTAHDSVDHDAIARSCGLTVDTRHACKPGPNVVPA